jgi:hypothetical protein
VTYDIDVFYMVDNIDQKWVHRLLCCENKTHRHRKEVAPSTTSGIERYSEHRIDVHTIISYNKTPSVHQSTVLV